MPTSMDNFDDHPSVDASLEDFEYNSPVENHLFPDGFYLSDIEDSSSSSLPSDDNESSSEDQLTVQRPWSPAGIHPYDYVRGQSWSQRYESSMSRDISDRLLGLNSGRREHPRTPATTAEQPRTPTTTTAPLESASTTIAPESTRATAAQETSSSQSDNLKNCMYCFFPPLMKVK